MSEEQQKHENQKQICMLGFQTQIFLKVCLLYLNTHNKILKIPSKN